MSNLNKLYDPIIKQHHANPYHFKKIQNASIIIKAYNPICGDKYEFYLENGSDKISSMHFHGFGCAISMAAASVLTKELEGQTLDTAIDLCEKYLGTLDGSLFEEVPKDFFSFTSVKDFPARYDCAAMACKEILKQLENFAL